MKKLRDFIFPAILLWILAIGVYLVLVTTAIWFGELNQDEGWYLYAAQMVHAGYLPFRDFFYTQGPLLPYVYSVFAPVWMADGALHGLLGARVLTALIGLVGTCIAVLLVRRIVPVARRGVASVLVFAALACTVYHVYFMVIPKTYALASLFVLMGFYLLHHVEDASSAIARMAYAAMGGFALSLAAGTRTSLGLFLVVTGIGLLFAWRHLRWAVVAFGLGGAVGLALLFVPLMMLGDAFTFSVSFHTARTGHDLFLVLGSVARVVRAYGAWVTLGAGAGLAWLFVARADAAPQRGVAWPWIWFVGCVAVMGLQWLSPFPYDDYQVPVMGLLAVVLTGALVRALPECPVMRSWIAAMGVALLCVASFASPIVQQWFVGAQDRFWVVRKDMSDLARLRDAAAKIRTLAAGDDTLLTQDTYLAVEAGLKVPRGFEMGPFCYFPELSDAEAARYHVFNTHTLIAALRDAQPTVAAFSGYGFSIAAPAMHEVPLDEQEVFWRILKERYQLAVAMPEFGQHATTLLILKRRAVENP